MKIATCVFLALASLLGAPAAAQSVTQWEYQLHSDPFTDVKTHTLVRLSDDLMAALAFSCEGAEPIEMTALWFDVPRTYGQEVLQMDWRIADQPPRSVPMNNVDLRKSETGFSVRNSTDAEDLARELFANDAAGIEVKFRADRKMSAVWTAGFSSAWDHLKSQCAGS